MINIKLTAEEIRTIISALDLQLGFADEDVNSDEVETIITKLENQLAEGVEDGRQQ